MSILIHAGDTGRGHYYSFNKNIISGTWQRFNDRTVAPETYERILQEAVGGIGNTSAYCLVYLADHIIQKEMMKANKEIVPHNSSIEKEYCIAQLPPDLAEYVNNDNNLFKAQIDSYKFSTNLSYAISLYRWKYQVTERIASRKSSMGIPCRYDSFATYLKTEPHGDKLLRWYLLDVSLKETGCCDDLRNLGDSPKLGAIQDRLSFLPKPYLFKIGLTASDKDDLDKKLAQYIAIYPIMICYNFFIKSLLNNQFKDACYAARKVLFVKQQNY